MVYVRAEGPKALSPEQWIQAARPERAEALSPEQWIQAARPEGAEALSPWQRIASHSNVFGRELAHLYIVLVHLFHLSIVNILSDYKQHALKGQKLLAQGSALGYHVPKPVAL